MDDGDDISDSLADIEDVITEAERENLCRTEKFSEKSKKCVAFEVNFGKPKVSLQAAFCEYKKRKISKCVEAMQAYASQEDRELKMRNAFVAQAKKYIGTPYSKKKWTPEDEEFYSPLFLDCCGLIRRVMMDLRFEFGFRLGPWNQGYLFDLLPITLDGLEQVKPGDLVFTEAIYYKSREKPQKHGLTHVEIFVGDGTKTIASRWSDGKVQEFDDYRFTSTLYHSQKYIFKSISTWIEGICKNCCAEHNWKWNSELFNPNGKSIFVQE